MYNYLIDLGILNTYALVAWMLMAINGYCDNGSDSKSPTKHSHQSAFYNIPVFVRIQIIDLPFVDSSARINSLMSASSRVVLSVSDLFTSERVCVQRAAIHCWYIHFAQFTVALAPTPSVFKPLPSTLRQRSSLDRR